MNFENNLVIQAFRDTQQTIEWNLPKWDLLIRQCRSANLLARLYYRLDSYRLLPTVPGQALFHLQSEKYEAEALAESIQWEIHSVSEALNKVDTPVIYLKGAAYALAHLPLKGRLYQDVDILVLKSKIPAVEAALVHHGWITASLDAYDQRYYRQWTHEIPPMKHIKRNSVIDVHHTILPPTARLHPDVDKLIDASVAVNENSKERVLSPIDMILHSATHLFHEGEFNNALRDLVDQDCLVTHFEQEIEGFWQALVNRAQQLELQRPLYYSLYFCHYLLLTKIPVDVFEQLKQCRGQPGTLLNIIMRFLYTRAFTPNHQSCDSPFNASIRGLLFVRSHYLRMPLYLLIPHLVRKAIIKPKD